MTIRSNKLSVYTVFANIPLYFYLLVIPVLQNYLFDPKGFFEHIASYSVSILSAAGAAIVSTADYHEKRFSAGDEGILAQMGLLVRTTYSFPYSRLHSVTFTQSPIMKLFSAVKLTLGAPKHCSKGSVFYIKNETAKKLRDGFFEGAGEAVVMRSKNRRIFLLSALLSNPIGGVFAAVPFIRAAGKAIGEETSGELLRSLDISDRLKLLGMPPVFAVIASILAVVYAVSVCVMFLRSANLTCRTYKGGIAVTSGAVRVKEVFIPYSSVKKTVIRQTPLMRLFDTAAVYVHVNCRRGKVFVFTGNIKETHLVELGIRSGGDRAV